MGNIIDNFAIATQSETASPLSDLVQRAQGLQSLLAKNATDSDRNRRASEENIQAIISEIEQERKIEERIETAELVKPVF